MKIKNTFPLLITFFCHVILASEFKYEKEIFELNPGSDITSNSPSLSDLAKDAENRKLYFTTLFELVKNNGVNKKTQKLFEKEAEAVNLIRGDKDDVPNYLIVFSRLKGDYCVERDLVIYVSECLNKFCNTVSNEKQIQKFYDQIVYIVRRNLQSLHDGVFKNLSSKYPENFKIVGEDKNVFRNNLKILGKEDELYYNFLVKFGDPKLEEKNSVEIVDMALYLLNKELVTCPLIISELNSISFYLNIERALLLACSSLEFDSKILEFHKMVSSQSNRFILSKLIDSYVGSGSLSDITTIDHQAVQKLIKIYTPKVQSTIIQGLCKIETSYQYINPFLEDIFPTPKISNLVGKKEEKTKKNRSKKKDKKSSSSTQMKKETTSKASAKEVQTLPEQKGDGEKSSEKGNKKEDTPANDKEDQDTQSEKKKNVEEISGGENERKEDIFTEVIEESEESDFQEIVDSENEREIEFLLGNSRKLNDTKKVKTVKKNHPSKAVKIYKTLKTYKTSLNFGDYCYKRFSRKQMDGKYFFNDTEFGFSNIQPFDIEMLKEIKKAICHSLKTDRLPNLASFKIRFHFKNENSEKLEIKEYSSGKKYVSGGKYFDTKDWDYKIQNKIFTAYNDILSVNEQEIFLKTGIEKRSIYLGKILEEKIRTSIVGGAWKNNCVDSEAILLLDLNNELPKYLKKITKNWSQKIELLGVALSISSYRDVCWRCINLIQGWQWGVRDAILHISKEGYINMPENFSTVALTFGEIAPDSENFFTPNLINGDLKLEKGVKPNEQHKLTCTKITRN